MTASLPADAPCPCGRLTYAQCCGPFIEQFDTCPAPDAQALMRSRFSAFAVGDEQGRDDRAGGHDGDEIAGFQLRQLAIHREIIAGFADRTDHINGRQLRTGHRFRHRRCPTPNH